MFIQVIQGPVADRDGLRRQLERWQTELKPGATGYLGSTGGVTDDGRYIGCVRFESAEAAKANSERPEQGAWFAETEKTFAGPISFQGCPDVDVYLGGGSDSAGFVQALQGGPVDRDRLRQLDLEFEALARGYRPDIIGWVVAWHPDDRFTSVVYFNSEDAARAGETQEPPEERKHLLEDWQSAVGELTFYDLRDPWLFS
jgi:heme-degrading monooxygenase HmoA